jgi:predicted dehydrogenase
MQSPVNVFMENTTSSSPGLPRREFIKKAAGAAAMVAAAPLLRTPVYGQATAPSANVKGANDRIAVGVIGVGFGIGKDHLQGIHKNCSANNTVLAAASDVYSDRRDYAKKEAELKDADVTLEYQKLLERKDIDAVLIATHDPMHAQITIDAVQAGKHVYCEKPLTRYLGEAFKVYDAVKRSGKVFQIGSQGCSATGWHKCAEMIQAGKLGKLVWAQGFYCRNNAGGEWNYPIDSTTTAENIDWKRWLGPVKERAFSAEDFHRWRKYYRYCGGLFSDLVPHRLLPLMLATGNPEFPVRVVSIGTHAIHEDKDKNAPEREVQEHIQLLAEFPSGALITITSSSVAEKSPGFTLYCHKASLNVGTSGERIEVVPEKQFAEEVDPETMRDGFQAEDIRFHESNWFKCIRDGKTPNAHIDLAVRAQTVISLAEMSDRLKMTCLFDEKTRKITDGSGKEVEAITYGTLPQS